jgi:hypothetical protein
MPILRMRRSAPRDDFLHIATATPLCCTALIEARRLPITALFDPFELGLEHAIFTGFLPAATKNAE